MKQKAYIITSLMRQLTVGGKIEGQALQMDGCVKRKREKAELLLPKAHGFLETARVYQLF